MRKRWVTLVIAILMVLPAAAKAQQQELLKKWPLGSVDFGFRNTALSGDEARFQRFRDIGNGAFLDRFRFQEERDGWFFELEANHAGRKDQRFFGNYESPKLRVSFEWDQIPLFISRDTRTLFSNPSPGVFRIDDSIQQEIETGQLTLSDVAGRASGFDTESRRDRAAFNLTYAATHDVDFEFAVDTDKREGNMPWGSPFGFNNAVELAAPLDNRTTDVSAAVEWANREGMLRVGYDGSWFSNDIQTLLWDNPSKFTDSTNPRAYVFGDGGSQGRAALWPSSTLHSFSTAGSLSLPARSRFTGNVTVGSWSQDEELLPFTINTAIPTIPLERTTAEAEARTLAMNYSLTSRPNQYLWLNARYRYYDFDNRTPRFGAHEYVRLDQVVEELHAGGSQPLGYTRNSLDFDASVTPSRFAALKLGYGRRWVDRTFRIFEQTTEDVIRASVDSTGNPWVSVRAIFEHSARTGSGFEPELLEEVGEQPALRHFDIADRDRNRISGVLQFTPLSSVGVTASVAAGKDDYENSGFGLRDNKNQAYSFTADVNPGDEVAMALSYTFEKYSALQNSRNASPGPQFDDPTRDWSIDSEDKVHTIGANLDLLKLFPKTEVRFLYDFTRSRAVYVYGLAPNSSLSAPVPLAPIENEIHTGTADLRYFLTPKLALGLMYWYDRYRVEDFALGPETISRIDLPGSLFLGYVYRPYTANSTWVRLLYFW